MFGVRSLVARITKSDRGCSVRKPIVAVIVNASQFQCEIHVAADVFRTELYLRLGVFTRNFNRLTITDSTRISARKFNVAVRVLFRARFKFDYGSRSDEIFYFNRVYIYGFLIRTFRRFYVPYGKIGDFVFGFVYRFVTDPYRVIFGKFIFECIAAVQHRALLKRQAVFAYFGGSGRSVDYIFIIDQQKHSRIAVLQHPISCGNGLFVIRPLVDHTGKVAAGLRSKTFRFGIDVNAIPRPEVLRSGIGIKREGYIALTLYDFKRKRTVIRFDNRVFLYSINAAYVRTRFNRYRRLTHFGYFGFVNDNRKISFRIRRFNRFRRSVNVDRHFGIAA